MKVFLSLRFFTLMSHSQDDILILLDSKVQGVSWPKADDDEEEVEDK